MKFYFIYSAGGGAGDWNGVKRVWNEYMPETLKSKILLKFGDVFLEHATGKNFIRPKRWRDINNLRDWLYENVGDEYIYSDRCNILLDSGTAKAVNMISHHNPYVSCDELINVFNKTFEENNVFEKYVSIVCNSRVDSAVTFDIPNPFKIRSQNGNAKLNILDREANDKLITLSAKYSNKIYSGLKKEKSEDFANKSLTTIINGTWNSNEINLFLDSLEYTPNKIAIGGLSSTSIKSDTMKNAIDSLRFFNLENSTQIHFLGCGGFKKVRDIKQYGLNGDNISVDCSTFINRSIDGSIDGKSQSGYYDYASKQLIRINPRNKDKILRLHSNAEEPLYSNEEMKKIIETILLHQNNQSSNSTYDARAKLMFHNADVYRKYIEE